jgi:hypothetical protein
MRFLFALVFSLFISANALAALTSDDWQSQLQQQIQQLQTQSPTIHANGNVTVQQGPSILRATLPAFTVTTPDQSYWSVPSIIMQISPSSGSVTIALPSTILRYNADKKEIARMVLGGQSLNGHWSTTGHYLESLNGVIKNMAFSDTIANAKSSVASVAIAANKGSPVEFVATDVRSMTVQNQKTSNTAIAKATIMYQMPSANQMTLAHLLGYLNPAILLAENQEVVFTMNAEQIATTDGGNRVTNLQKLTTKFDLRPNGTTVSGNVSAQALIVTQNPASAYGFVLPRQADLTASISNLPIEMVSFAPGMSANMAKSAMANAGTIINISKLNMTTFDQGKLNGTGMFKATNETPSGFTGRLTLNIENLKDLIASNQMQLLQPDKNTNRSAKTQSLMAMMMLQGMGKQNGNETEFVLDLTSDGQTLVNGQDLSGLVGGGKAKTKTIETVPSVPVQPVKSSNL